MCNSRAMLTPKEAEGLTAILRSLDLEKLLAISRTVTKNMIKFESSDEAIKAALAYTDKPSDLLRRQKITKQVIFNYLRSTGTVVSVNTEKKNYVLACLKLWQSLESVKTDDFLDDQEELCGKSDSMCVQTGQLTANGVHSACALLEPENVHKFSMEFLVWFFDTINRLNNFGSHHFWPDCKLLLVVRTPSSVITQNCLQTADCVAKAFFGFIVNDKLYFNPNITKEDVRCEQERHGLVKIAASGVVHKINNCIGMFDFLFGLVQDPAFNNNWKIKAVQMDLQISASECATIGSFAVSKVAALPMVA